MRIGRRLKESQLFEDDYISSAARATSHGGSFLSSSNVPRPGHSAAWDIRNPWSLSFNRYGIMSDSPNDVAE